MFQFRSSLVSLVSISFPVPLLAWLCATSCLSRYHRDEPRLEPAVLQERLDEDLEQIAALRRGLAARPFTVEALLRELDSGGYTYEGGAIGEGARRVVLTLDGGHTTTRVAIFAAAPGAGGESAIARLELEQGFEPDIQRQTRDEIEAELYRAWGEDATELWGLHRVERVDLELDAALLGPVPTPAIDPPPELAEAFRELMDAQIQFAVGTGCGFAPFPPRGFVHTSALVTAGRFDLLRAVLRGPNPEARVYAAHALSEHGALEPADAATIAILARLPFQLVTCDGCLWGHEEWDAAFHGLDRG